MRVNRLTGATIVLGMILAFGTGARPVAAEQELERALGASTAVALYEMQMVLGLSADGFAKKVYTAEQMETLIGEQKGFVKNLDKELSALLKLDSVTEADKKSLKEMSDCLALMGATADALLAYVKDSSDKNADKFQEARKASHAALAELMGLDK
ncbi:MAG: hypothetical protein K8T20_05675 [Planctomycetes bacterium]|nr:hypothetical protein [Planctomycetota bacterium]